MASSGEEETNVRVAARVRPLLPREKAANCCSCVTVQPGGRQVVVGTRRAFAFDVVFDTHATQTEVYEECGASLLQGCMQGYNATILAYGQTGSGKTFTMGTGQTALQGAPEDEGIVPKVIRNIFEHIEQNKHETDFKVSCCYLEIYNEEIRDLLQPGVPKHLISVRETAAGVIQVAGIRAEACISAEQMLRCLGDGSVQRTTGATLMNEQSSRSHSIFSVILEQRRKSHREAGLLNEEAMYCTAKFHLVDLAGSERAKRTGAVGSRLKESVAINSGLLALGNVISALGDPAKRGSHVPYRESKLTRLLQDSLGGNSRTWMVACASCADGDFEETLNTLKYAHRARNIKNKPVVNHDPRVAQLAAMQDEIQALRSELQRVSEGSPLVMSSEAQECGELAEKLEASEQRSVELSSRLASAEADSEALRRSLGEVYSLLCLHLPAIWHAPGGTAVGAGASGKEALTVLCESLQSARRVLSSVSCSDLKASMSDNEDLPRFPASLLAAAGIEKVHLAVDLSASLDLMDFHESANQSLSVAEAGDTGRLKSYPEMRKDSSVLIRKYLDEIKSLESQKTKLETELVLYRRRTRQLQEELREAREDLQKDEDIFAEKMQEMKALKLQNEELETELRNLLSNQSLRQPPARFDSQEFSPLSSHAVDVAELWAQDSRLPDRAEVNLDPELQAAPAGKKSEDFVGLKEQGPTPSQSSSQACRLEQQLDEHIQLQEAAESLQEDLKKQEALLRKKERYTSYRRQIAAKDAVEQQKARERLRHLEVQLAQAEETPGDLLRLREEHTEIEKNLQAKLDEGRSILHDVDEKLEGIQDELDFWDARIAKARSVLGAAGAAHQMSSLDQELATVSPNDAKELLHRYCSKLISLRQREKQQHQRLQAAEALLEEQKQQVEELQQVLRRQNANSSNNLAKVTKEYESKLRILKRQSASAETEDLILEAPHLEMDGLPT